MEKASRPVRGLELVCVYLVGTMPLYGALGAWNDGGGGTHCGRDGV